MSRQLRIQYEGAFYHVIARGNQGDHVFSNDEDKAYLIGILSKAHERYDLVIYAYCIMGNHYHLLMETREANLSKAMHFVGSSFASYMSRRGALGHIFSGRYKAILVEKEEYLVTLSRYIHLNPVAAGIVDNPQDYPWSSCRFYYRKESIPHWLDMTWIIGEFGSSSESAEYAYRQFIEDGLGRPYEYPVEKIRANSVLGSREFFIKATSAIGSDKCLDQVTGKEQINKLFNLDDINRAICEFFRIDDLTGLRDRKQGESNYKLSNYPCKMFVFLAKEHTVALNKEIGGYLDNPSPSTISSQYSRIKKSLESDDSLAAQWSSDVMAILKISESQLIDK